MLLFLLVRIGLSTASSIYINMYPGKYYDNTYYTTPCVTRIAKMKNIYYAGDYEQEDIYF